MKYKAMRFENICKLTDYLNDNNIKPTDIVGIYVRNQSQTQPEFDLLYIESDKSEEKLNDRDITPLMTNAELFEGFMEWLNADTENKEGVKQGENDN